MNSPSGHSPRSKPRKGIDIPSLKASLASPQYLMEASWRLFSNFQEYFGALNPVALITFFKVTLALQGGLSVKSLTNCFSASLGFLVGGSLMEMVNSLYGRRTLPAEEQSGIPEAPIIAICGFQPLKMIELNGFLCALSISPKRGNSLIDDSPFVFTNSYISSYLLGGMSTWKISFISPVLWSSSLSSSSLRILKAEGTIPDASPLCTPSVSTSTRKVPSRTPLRELVIQSLSQSSAPLSKQKNKVGFPIRSLSLRMYVSI